MTGDLVLLLVLVLAIAGNLYVSIRTLGQTQQLIAQVAVLTIRVLDTCETVEALDTDLRGEQPNA
jgi:hypothetical protein